MNFTKLIKEEQLTILANVAEDKGIVDNAVEKNYWLSMVLRAIFSLPYAAAFVFKGGTSLSKGWGLIEEFERVNLPLPTVEENCGGVMVTIQRKTMDEVIAERGNGELAGVNVGNMSGTNVGNVSTAELSNRQRFIIYAIKADPNITAKAMSETLSVTQRTIERDLAVLQKAGIIRHEGKVNAGIWVVLENSKV